MLKKFRIAQGGDFTRHVFTLLGGTALAQVIPLIAAPFLTRMYSPEQFGLLALLMAVVNPLSVIISGRYEQAIMLPKEKKDSANLVVLSLLITVLVSFFFFVVFYVTRGYFVNVFRVPGWSQVAVIAPFILLLIGIWQPVNYWLIRQKEYKRMAANKIIQMSAIGLLSLLFGRLAIHEGLLWGYWGGWAMVAVFSVYQLFQADMNTGMISKNKMLEVAFTYKDFPLFNALPSLLNTAALSIPVFIIARNYSSGDAGHFNLCRQLLFVPSSFIATAIAQVYYQRITANKHDAKKLAPEFLRIVKILSAISFLMIIVLIFFGPGLFAIFFGEGWRTSGEYARILSFSVCTQFVVVPLSVTFSALQKIRQNSVWQLVYFISIACLYLFRFENITHFLLVLTMVETIYYLFYFARIFVMVKQHDRENGNAS